MIRLFVVCVFLLVGSFAQASGKISFQPTYDSAGKTGYPVFGFSVYEKLADKTFANLWFGAGDIVDCESCVPKSSDGRVLWITSRNQIDYYIKHPWVISPGFQLIKVTSDDKINYRLFVRATMQVW
jgi:hypothetical protein